MRMPASLSCAVAALAASALASVCAKSPANHDAVTITLTGRVVAGPGCPVEDIPPDPACAPAPLPGARLDVLESSGRKVATVVADGQGRFSVSLPPGRYVIVPKPFDTLPHPPRPITIEIRSGLPPPAEILIVYDTGVR